MFMPPGASLGSNGSVPLKVEANPQRACNNWPKTTNMKSEQNWLASSDALLTS